MIIGTITLLTILFFGGSGFDFLGLIVKMDDKVEDIVTDPATAGEVHVILQAYVSEYEIFVEQVEKQRTAIRDVDLRADATEADYRRVLDSLHKVWVQRESRGLELRSQLRAKTTREEWDALHEDMRKKLDKMQKDLDKKRRKAESS